MTQLLNKITDVRVDCSAYKADASFPRTKLAKAIKAAGGSFSSVRGDRSYRFINLPITDETRSLLDDLVRTYGTDDRRGGTTVIVEGATTHLVDMTYPGHPVDSHHLQSSERCYAATPGAVDIAGHLEVQLETALARLVATDRYAAKSAETDATLSAQRIEQLRKSIDRQEEGLAKSRQELRDALTGAAS